MEEGVEIPGNSFLDGNSYLLDTFFAVSFLIPESDRTCCVERRRW